MTCKRMTRTYEVDGHPRRSWYLAGTAGVAELLAAPALGPDADIVINGERWQGVALGLHTPYPQYAGQEAADGCPLMDGVPCYFEFSSLAASRLMREWADTGDDEVVWNGLATEYAEAERLAAEPVGR